MYFQTGSPSSIQCFQGSRPTFHGIGSGKVGVRGFKIIWDKATSYILLSELSEGPAM